MSSHPTNRGTALLVDDEAYFRRFVGRLLQNEGFTQVVEAKDGNEAVQLFATVRPQVVILDINMPHRDGIETLHALRQCDADLPIIMLTSVADEAMVERCVEEGATYFIRKDVAANILSAELHDVLEGFEGDPT